MSIRISNPEINDCGGNGIRIGAGAEHCLITNPVISNCNGHGIMIEASTDALITSPKISNIGKDGVHIFSEGALLKQLNLPDTIDENKLEELLRLLKRTPEEDRLETIKGSFLAELNNLTGIANNILQMLPNLPQF